MVKLKNTRLFLYLLIFLLLPGCTTAPKPGTNLFARQLFTEGLSYEALAEYSSALDRFEKVIERRKKAPSWANRAHLRMARIHRNKLNNSESAIRNYRAFLSNTDSDSTQNSIRLELARVYTHHNQYDTAIRTYNKIIESKNTSSNVQEAFYNLGEVYIDSEDYENAIELYEKFLDKFPEANLADGAAFNLAQAYGEAGQASNQLKAYQTLLEDYPESGLREYAFMQAVRAATAQGKKSLSLEWARKYASEYSEGQYWDQITSLLEETYEINEDKLESEKTTYLPGKSQ